MKKSLMILAAILSVGLFGCSTESSDGLTKEEQEAIYREEVRKKLDEEAAEEAEKEAAEEPEDEPEDEPEETNGAATFDALPKGVQAAVISTFYDERATADSLVNGGMYTSYAFDEPYLIIQVTSGAGTGHPIYLLELQEDTYIPVDGVVYVGANTVESAAPPQVDVTLAELAEEYETNQTLYDQTHDPSYTWDMTLADFEAIKNQIGQTSGPRETPTPVTDEVVGTVDGVTNTIIQFYTIGGSVGVHFSIHNGSENTIEFSPYDIQLYLNGEQLGINDAGPGGVLAPGEMGESYILFHFMGFEPYLLDWMGHQLIMTPVVS